MRSKWLPRAALVALLAMVSVGCSMRSPVLLYRGTEAMASTIILPVVGKELAPAQPGAIPLKAGIRVAASRDKKLVNIRTWMFPFYTFTGGFPKRDESEFLRDSIARDLLDTRTFTYTYPAPFDPTTVDIIVDVTPTDVLLSNDSNYSLLVNLPYINIITLCGVPQEKFQSRLAFTFDIKKPDGTVIKSYKTSADGQASVTLYQEPWGNYLWYKSVFRDTFLQCMDDFRKQLVADAATIRQQAGNAAR